MWALFAVNFVSFFQLSLKLNTLSPTDQQMGGYHFRLWAFSDFVVLAYLFEVIVMRDKTNSKPQVLWIQ